MCGAKSANGIACNQENDIIIPVRCRNKTETEKGIQAGAEAAYIKYNFEILKFEN